MTSVMHTSHAHCIPETVVEDLLWPVSRPRDLNNYSDEGGNLFTQYRTVSYPMITVFLSIAFIEFPNEDYDIADFEWSNECINMSSTTTCSPNRNGNDTCDSK